MRNRKITAALLLLGVFAGTVATGLYFQHYFVVFVFSTWLVSEALLWRAALRLPRATSQVQSPFRSLFQLLDLYGKHDTPLESVAIVESRIAELKREGRLNEAQSRELWRLRDLLELRTLALGDDSGFGKKRGFRRGFAYVKVPPVRSDRQEQLLEGPEPISGQDIIEAANVVADLYWKLYDCALGKDTELSVMAKQLYQRLFAEEFEATRSRFVIEKLTDAIHRDEGVSFLVLNLIRRGEVGVARKITQNLLQNEITAESDAVSALYWLTEIYWFSQQSSSPIKDFDTAMRHLYHLCFTNPERAGFLEIDSQFFSQFSIVSELAREGFIFKEGLIEKILHLWWGQEGYFDNSFSLILEVMTQSRSKIYDDLASWEMFWKRERDSFGKEYLYVVEGNLSYAEKDYQAALNCYDKALQLSPNLRSARFNRLFCYAKLGRPERHDTEAQLLVKEKTLRPASLYVAGNSFLLRGDAQKAEPYFAELKKVAGWERKVDYYRSSFCYEQGLYDLALQFALAAKEQNPYDTSIRYHLSLCYNAMGKKDDALKQVREIDSTPDWLRFYRFTLERDSGREHEASQTLLEIPKTYFQEDEDEWEAAVEFAKRSQNLALLRHLRNR